MGYGYNIVNKEIYLVCPNCFDVLLRVPFKGVIAAIAPVEIMVCVSPSLVNDG